MEEIKVLICGCCSNGCVCWDRKNGPRLPEQKCDVHGK
jgi:hypothetical protein